MLLRKQAKPDITFNLVMSGFFLPNNPPAVDEWGCYRRAGKIMQGVFFRFFYAMKECLRINHAFALVVIFHDIQLRSFYIKGPYV
ncbi:MULTISPECIES: hypothetical protein [unclassified Klebsiella]|uniref:hypothetical protein n=1 Tax=unclassified Klebsiella TaxID=2608929 RepID=UPI001CA4C00E|nr:MULTISPECIES: hypothetical protein [unclassified Klebsiella]